MWGTHEQNMWQVLIDGRNGDGVYEINFVEIMRLAKGGMFYTKIAEKLELSPGTVYMIIRGRRFKNACTPQYFEFKRFLREMKQQSLEALNCVERVCERCESAFIDDNRLNRDIKTGTCPWCNDIGFAVDELSVGDISLTKEQIKLCTRRPDRPEVSQWEDF